MAISHIVETAASALGASDLGAHYPHVVPISLFVAVLCFCTVVGHHVEKNNWLTESIVCLLTGLVCGILILVWSKGTSTRILQFNEELFFICLLPPIIFNAGFRAKKKHLFDNFSTIFLFGVVGSCISTGIIGVGSWVVLPNIGLNGLTARDYFALGAIFSSTDTVCTLQILNQDETPTLYSLVFGEGVVNDASSIVLLKAIQKLESAQLGFVSFGRVIQDFAYLFSTSTILGVSVGLLASWSIKKFLSRDSTNREISLLVLMSYLSYMLAELLNLSGILAVFLCGITISHYGWHHLTKDAKTTSMHTFASLSYVSELFIFVYVGMDTVDIDKWRSSNSSVLTWFIMYFSFMFLILLGRAAFIFPISALSNYLYRKTEGTQISYRNQIIVWWAGLTRGAVSVALAFKQFTNSGITGDQIHATMITNTLIIVFTTTLFFGVLTRSFISKLVPHHELDVGEQNSTIEEDLSLPLLTSKNTRLTRILSAKRSLTMLISKPRTTIHTCWREFDDAYMRPVFGGPPKE